MCYNSPVLDFSQGTDFYIFAWIYVCLNKDLMIKLIYREYRTTVWFQIYGFKFRIIGLSSKDLFLTDTTVRADSSLKNFHSNVLLQSDIFYSECPFKIPVVWFISLLKLFLGSKLLMQISVSCEEVLIMTSNKSECAVDNIWVIHVN